MVKLSRGHILDILHRLTIGWSSIYHIVKEYHVTPRWIREIRRRAENGLPLPGGGHPGRPPRPITQDEIDFVLAGEREDHLHPGSLEQKLDEIYGIHIPHNRLYRILKKIGRVVPTPSKQRKRSWVRFERRHSNSLWQMDFTQLLYREWLLVLIDDASRLITGYAKVRNPTASIAWETFLNAGEKYGFPKQLLTDHGCQFTTNSEKAVGSLDENLYRLRKKRGIKVQHIMSRVKHPQTGGKVERVFVTIKSKLKARWPDGEKEFDSLDEIIVWYNTDKPHMSLNYQRAETPIQAFIRKLRPEDRKSFLKRYKED